MSCISAAFAGLDAALRNLSIQSGLGSDRTWLMHEESRSCQLVQVVTLEGMICNWLAGEIDSTVDPTYPGPDLQMVWWVWSMWEHRCRCLYSVTGQELHVAWPTERDPAAAVPVSAGQETLDPWEYLRRCSF